MRQGPTAVVLIAALAASAIGCGGGSQTTTERNRPKETAQKLPKLPAGWKARRDRSIGYAIGVPTGWAASGHGDRVLFRSPDHLVAVALTAGSGGLRRLGRALGGAGARRAAGLQGPARAWQAEALQGEPLEAVQTTANGTQAGGLEERATLVVLRRDRIVNYTVAVLQNAEHPGSELDRAVALRMVETLRDLPPKGADGHSGSS